MVNYKKIKFYILVIMILASLSLFLFADKLGLDQKLSAGNLENNLPSVIIYLAWMTFASATTLPISLVLIPGILLFSFQWAIILSFIGIVLGALIIYYLTIFLGKDFVEDWEALSSPAYLAGIKKARSQKKRYTLSQVKKELNL